MSHPLRVVLVLVATGALVASAGELEPPRIFFREPDGKTARRIEELIHQLNDSAADARARARADLAAIGPWSAVALDPQVHGRRMSKAMRVRMNAVLALARLPDPRALPAVRAAAADADPWVRRSALLALGVLPDDANRAPLLAALGGAEPRAAALALAKRAGAEGAKALLDRARGRVDEADKAAAFLLAAVIVDASAADLCLRVLEDVGADKLLRRTAAVGLVVRPLPAERANVLLSRLDDPRERDHDLRVLLYEARGAIAPPPEGLRARLCDAAAGRTEKADRVQLAAARVLASGGESEELYRKLRPAAREDRNSEAVVARLFALLRLGGTPALEDVLAVARSSSTFLQTHAVANLLHFVALSPEPHPLEDRVYDAATRLPSNDDFGAALGKLAKELRAIEDRAARAARARGGLAALGDPRGLHLWDRTAEEHRWALVNALLPEIFRLDAERAESELAPDGSRKVAGGTPEELDLLRFFAEKPYFGAEDLR